MVQTIYLNGEERPVSFAISTLIAFEKEAGVNFLNGESVQNLNLSKLGKLAFLGLKFGAKVNQIKFPYKEEDVLEWFPTLDSLTQVIELFTEAMPAPEEEEEKKVSPV
jgi:hypothetical protein